MYNSTVRKIKTILLVLLILLTLILGIKFGSESGEDADNVNATVQVQPYGI